MPGPAGVLPPHAVAGVPPRVDAAVEADGADPRALQQAVIGLRDSPSPKPCSEQRPAPSDHGVAVEAGEPAGALVKKRIPDDPLTVSP